MRQLIPAKYFHFLWKDSRFDAATVPVFYWKED
jgi:hypothetical protein